MDQGRDRNGEFGNKRFSDDVVNLPVPDLAYLATLRQPQNSVESSFLDAFREDPTEELLQHWRNELQNVDALESSDPLRLLTPGDRAQLKAFINDVSRRRLRHESRIDLDAWEPGEDANTDAEVIQEAEKAAGDLADLDYYEPGEDVDADDIVAVFILAHRALTDSFPQMPGSGTANRPAPSPSAVNVDEWEPGEDADTDAEVIRELAAAVGDRVDLGSYAPAEDVDSDALVARFIGAHRALRRNFPRE